jgi:hypothetical protein
MAKQSSTQITEVATVLASGLIRYMANRSEQNRLRSDTGSTPAVQTGRKTKSGGKAK